MGGVNDDKGTGAAGCIARGATGGGELGVTGNSAAVRGAKTSRAPAGNRSAGNCGNVAGITSTRTLTTTRASTTERRQDLAQPVEPGVRCSYSWSFLASSFEVAACTNSSQALALPLEVRISSVSWSIRISSLFSRAPAYETPRSLSAAFSSRTLSVAAALLRMVEAALVEL